MMMIGLRVTHNYIMMTMMMMMKTFLLDNQKPFPHIIILGDSDHHNRLRGIASERERGEFG